MKIKLNSDQEVVDTIREGLKRTSGYCPCRVEQGNHGLVLRVMYVKTDGKFTEIFLVRHGSHRSPS